jgi:hypothetical protein
MTTSPPAVILNNVWWGLRAEQDLLAANMLAVAMRPEVTLTSIAIEFGVALERDDSK